jgi:hypothetical protein
MLHALWLPEITIRQGQADPYITKPKTADAKIENIQRKMDDIAGISAEKDKYANLEVDRNSAQTDRAQILEDLKKEHPELADIVDKRGKRNVIYAS